MPAITNHPAPGKPGGMPRHGEERVDGRGPAATQRAEHLGHAAVLTPPRRVHELGLERPAGAREVELGAGHRHVAQPDQEDRHEPGRAVGGHGDQARGDEEAPEMRTERSASEVVLTPREV